MRALLQRVTRASVTVDGSCVGEIGPGLLVLLGLPHLFAQWVLSKSRFELQRTRTLHLRRSKYYQSLLTKYEHTASIQTMRLAPHLLDQFRSAVGVILGTSRRIYRAEAIVSVVSGVVMLAAILMLALVFSPVTTAAALRISTE